MAKTYLKQTQSKYSVEFKDDHTMSANVETGSLVDGASAHLQRDMNFLRTQIRNITGESKWYDLPDDTLAQLAANTTLDEKYFIIGINLQGQTGPDAQQAGVHGVKVEPFTLDGSSNSLDIIVDGGVSQNVTFSTGAVAASTIASEFNGSITGATASATANGFVVISSDSLVDGVSKLELESSSNVLDALGFSAAEGSSAINGKTYFQYTVTDDESTAQDVNGAVVYRYEGTDYHFSNGEIYNEVGEQLIDDAGKEVFFRTIDYVEDGAGGGLHVLTCQTHLNLDNDKTGEYAPYFSNWEQGNTSDDMTVDIIYPFRKNLDSMGQLDLTQSTFRQNSGAERDQETVADILNILNILGADASGNDSSLTYSSTNNITQNADVETVVSELDSILGPLGSLTLTGSSLYAQMGGATALVGFTSNTVVEALNELKVDISNAASSITLQDAYDNDADSGAATIATNNTDGAVQFTSTSASIAQTHNLFELLVGQTGAGVVNTGNAIDLTIGEAGGDAGSATGSAIKIEYADSQFVPANGVIQVTDGGNDDLKLDKGGVLTISNATDNTGKVVIHGQGAAGGLDIDMNTVATDVAIDANAEARFATGGSVPVHVKDGEVEFQGAGLVETISNDLDVKGANGVNVTATAEDIDLSATTASVGGITLNGPTDTIQSKIDVGVADDGTVAVQADDVTITKDAAGSVLIKSGSTDYFEFDASENLILGDDAVAASDAFIKVNNDADIEINSQGSGVLVTGRGSVVADFGKTTSGTLDLDASIYDLAASSSATVLTPAFDLKDDGAAGDPSVISLASGDLTLGDSSNANILVEVVTGNDQITIDGASDLIFDTDDLALGVTGIDTGVALSDGDSASGYEWHSEFSGTGISVIRAINESMKAAADAQSYAEAYDTLQEVYDNQALSGGKVVLDFASNGPISFVNGATSYFEIDDTNGLVVVEQPLDMSDNKILNVPDGTENSDGINYGQLVDAINGLNFRENVHSIKLYSDVIQAEPDLDSFAEANGELHDCRTYLPPADGTGTSPWTTAPGAIHVWNAQPSVDDWVNIHGTTGYPVDGNRFLIDSNPDADSSFAGQGDSIATYEEDVNEYTVSDASADFGSNQISITGHGLTGGEIITFTTVGGGTLPAPLAVGPHYFAKRIDDDTLEIYFNKSLSRQVTFGAGSGEVEVHQDRWTFEAAVKGWATVVHRHETYPGPCDSIGFTYTDEGWVQYTAAGQLDAGEALEIVGNTINVRVDDDDLDATLKTIEVYTDTNGNINATADQTRLRVKADGIKSEHILLENDTWLRMKNSGGTTQNILKMNASDDIVLGDGQDVTVDSENWSVDNLGNISTDGNVSASGSGTFDEGGNPVVINNGIVESTDTDLQLKSSGGNITFVDNTIDNSLEPLSLSDSTASSWVGDFPEAPTSIMDAINQSMEAASTGNTLQKVYDNQSDGIITLSGDAKPFEIDDSGDANILSVDQTGANVVKFFGDSATGVHVKDGVIEFQGASEIKNLSGNSAINSVGILTLEGATDLFFDTDDLALGAGGINAGVALTDGDSASGYEWHSFFSGDGISIIRAINESIVAAETVTLQEAYENGNTITTNSADGDVVFGGTEKVDITADGGTDITNNLVVGGTTTGTGDIVSLSNVAASGDLLTDGDLNVGGDADITNNLDVGGTTTGTGDIISLTNIVASGNVLTDGDVTAGGDITVDGSATFDNDGNKIIINNGTVESPDTDLTLESSAGDVIFKDSSLTDSVSGGVPLSSPGYTDWHTEITDGSSLIQAINETMSKANDGDTLQEVYDNQSDGIITLSGDGKPFAIEDSANAGILTVDQTGDNSVTVASVLDVNVGAVGDIAVDADGKIVAASSGTPITLESAKISTNGALEISNSGANALELLKSETGTLKIGTAGVELIGIDASEVLTIGDASTATIVDAENWTVDVDGNMDLDGTLDVTGNATLDANLQVDGTSDLNDSVDLDNDDASVAAISIKNSNTSGPVIDLEGATSGTLGILVPNTITSYDVVMPSAQGATNAVLTNDGAGNLSWTVNDFVVTLQDAYENGNTIGTSAGEGDVTITGTETFVVDTTGGIDFNVATDADNNSATVATITLKNADTSGALLDLEGATAGTLGILVPNTVTDHDLVLPAAQGGADTVLTNDGSGNLSWTAGDSFTTLQDAYENGNTIVTDNTNGDVNISGTENFIVDVDGDATVDAANWSIDSAGDMNIDGSLTVDSDGGTSSINIGVSGNTIDSTEVKIVSTGAGGDVTIESADEIIFKDDNTTSEINFSDSTNTSLPPDSVSILDALNQAGLGSVKRKGIGVGQGTGTATQSIQDITGDAGLTYFSNNGGTGTDSSSEGFYMDVYLNGQLLQAGSGLDYREDTTTGTGREDITFLNAPYPGASDNMTFIIRRK